MKVPCRKGYSGFLKRHIVYSFFLVLLHLVKSGGKFAGRQTRRCRSRRCGSCKDGTAIPAHNLCP